MLFARRQVHPATAHFRKPAVLQQLIERGSSVELAIDAAWIRAERGRGYSRAVRNDACSHAVACISAIQVAARPRERAADNGERRIRITGSAVVPAAGGVLVAVRERRVANMIIRASADKVVGRTYDGVG